MPKPLILSIFQGLSRILKSFNFVLKTTMTNYFLKAGYKTNITEEGEVTQKYTGPPLDKTWQISVYKQVGKLLSGFRSRKTLELGSGSGYKLMKFIYPISKNVSGIDYPHSVEYCKNHYPNGNWIAEDFDNYSSDHADKYDLILSVDVIEHLVSPEKLIDKIKYHASSETTIIISTPERDKLRGPETMGPPPNKMHVREWNEIELKAFLEDQGLKVIEQQILPAKIRSFREAFYDFRRGYDHKTCQMAICKLAN